MKILFYTEMHPIRESYINHSWIVSEIIKMVGKETDNFRILANKSIFDMFKKENNKIFIDIKEEEEENKLNSFYKKHWDAISIKDWVDLMLGESVEYTSFYSSILNRVRLGYNFDVVVYWGTNNTLKKYCDINHIPSVAMELGCTRDPNFVQTVYMDIKGVNGLNSLNYITFEDIAKTKTTIKKEVCLKSDYNLNLPLSDKVLNEILLHNWGKNVLVPLQLDDDSNILLYAEHSSVLDFVKYVVNRFSEKGYTCFIKPHPGANHRKYNLDKHLEIKKYVGSLENVYWLDDVDFLGILNKINIVITQNSSLAFESILLDKVVINLGKSCWYNEDVFPSIDDFLLGRFDVSLYLPKIKKLAEFILEYYLVPQNRAFTFKFFKERIHNLVKLYQDDKKGYNYFSIFTEKTINKPLDYLFPNKEIIKEKEIQRYQRDISVEEYNAVVGEIFGNKKIHQSFECSKNNLFKIDIMFATYIRENSGSIKITLSEDIDLETNITLIVPCETIKDNEWLYFEFPEITNSADKKYFVKIEGINCRIGKSVTVYYNTLKQGSGELFINRTKFKGSLCFRTYCKN